MNSRQSKFLKWINYRVRVIIQDNRHLVGTLLAFDKHMNLVLADTEEFTRIKSKKEGGLDKERKRGLGLILLRGENIVSFSAESPPSENNDLITETKHDGEGKSVPIGRGVPIDMNNLINSGKLGQIPGVNTIPGSLPGGIQGVGNPLINPLIGGRGMIPNVQLNGISGLPPGGFPPFTGGIPGGVPIGGMPPNMIPPHLIRPGFPHLGGGFPPINLSGLNQNSIHNNQIPQSSTIPSNTLNSNQQQN